MTFTQKLRQLKISQDKAILILASDWVKENFKYQVEGGLNEDIWIRSVQDVIDKSRYDYGRADCDDYAQLTYITCERFVNDGKDNLRLAIVKHNEIGLHMVCIYYGEGRKNPLLVTSTGVISDKPLVTLQEAWNSGWWITHTFNSRNVWRHRKPREV